MIPNVFAEGRIILDRKFQVAVMKAQANLASIMERERITRRDVKARIE